MLTVSQVSKDDILVIEGILSIKIQAHHLMVRPSNKFLSERLIIQKKWQNVVEFLALKKARYVRAQHFM